MFKRLFRRQWAVEFLCKGCRNHYCGDCGRGVSDIQYFWTYGGAVLAAHDWICQQEADPGVKATMQVLPGETIISYGDDETLYAVVSKRQ